MSTSRDLILHTQPSLLVNYTQPITQIQSVTQIQSSIKFPTATAYQGIHDSTENTLSDNEYKKLYSNYPDTLDTSTESTPQLGGEDFDWMAEILRLNKIPDILIEKFKVQLFESLTRLVYNKVSTEKNFFDVIVEYYYYKKPGISPLDKIADYLDKNPGDIEKALKLITDETNNSGEINNILGRSVELSQITIPISTSIIAILAAAAITVLVARLSKRTFKGLVIITIILGSIFMPFIGAVFFILYIPSEYISFFKGWNLFINNKIYYYLKNIGIRLEKDKSDYYILINKLINILENINLSDINAAYLQFCSDEENKKLLDDIKNQSLKLTNSFDIFYIYKFWFYTLTLIYTNINWTNYVSQGNTSNKAVININKKYQKIMKYIEPNNNKLKYIQFKRRTRKCDNSNFINSDSANRLTT